MWSDASDALTVSDIHKGKRELTVPEQRDLTLSATLLQFKCAQIIVLGSHSRTVYDYRTHTHTQKPHTKTRTKHGQTENFVVPKLPLLLSSFEPYFFNNYNANGVILLRLVSLVLYTIRIPVRRSIQLRPWCGALDVSASITTGCKCLHKAIN